MITERHFQLLLKAISGWLQPDNRKLKQAIDRSVDEKLFSFEDIRHQILVLKQNVTESSLRKWLEQNKPRQTGSERNRILFLHAGNLPLVGFQDVIAAVLTGSIYAGKLSRKDPYLLPTFLECLQEAGLFSDALWHSDIENFRELQADAMIFSGSGKSVREVQAKTSEIKAVSEGAPELVRSAHFSLAYIEDRKPDTFRNLAEAVFRYGGLGCRSVHLVVAPFSLNSIKCEFTDYAESFWLTNPQHRKPAASLFYRYACNKAVGFQQSWLDDFLIEETEKMPETDFVLHWVQGGPEKVKELTVKAGMSLQSVYHSGSNDVFSDLSIRPEPLSTAQEPPVYWKPDGIDTVNWILELNTPANR